MSQNMSGAICPQCHIANRSTARVCRNCGAPLNVTSNTQQVPPPVPVPLEQVTQRIAPDGNQTRRLQMPGFMDLPLRALVHGRYEVLQTFEVKQTSNSYLVTSSQSQKHRILYESAGPDQFDREKRWIDLHLEHPALVEMEEAFEVSYGDHTRSYLAVELPLAPVITLANRSELEILQAGAQLAEALALVHDKGVVHGNIRPNAIYESNSQCKLWGSATGATLSADVRKQEAYQLAGVLYQLATAQGEKAPAFSPMAMQVFQQALGEDTRSRYPDARVFHDELSKVVEALRHPRTLTTIVGRLSDVGLKRELDEDSLLTMEIAQYTQIGSQVIGLYAVADGMGGTSAGEVASKMVTDVLAREVTKNLVAPRLTTPGAELDYKAILDAATQLANAEVQQARQRAHNDMGSTLVAALLDGNQAYIVNVGDSRAYLIAPDRIQKVTKDHSLVQALADRGQITEAEIRSHPQRNFILRNMGDKPQVQADLFTLTLEVGQSLLLCCDGLWEMVLDDEIRQIVAAAPDPQEAVRQLIQAANLHGGDDNITCVLVRVDNAQRSAK